MKQEKITSIQGDVIYTAQGQRRAIGNADHKIGDWVWVNGMYVFGTQQQSSNTPYITNDMEGKLRLFPAERMARFFIKGTEPDDWGKEDSNGNVIKMNPAPIEIEMKDYFGEDMDVIDRTDYFLCYNKHARYILSYRANELYVMESVTLDTWNADGHTKTKIPLNKPAAYLTPFMHMYENDSNLYWCIYGRIGFEGTNFIYKGLNNVLGDNLLSDLNVETDKIPNTFGTTVIRTEYLYNGNPNATYTHIVTCVTEPSEIEIEKNVMQNSIEVNCEFTVDKHFIYQATCFTTFRQTQVYTIGIHTYFTSFIVSRHIFTDDNHIFITSYLRNSNNDAMVMESASDNQGNSRTTTNILNLSLPEIPKLPDPLVTPKEKPLKIKVGKSKIKSLFFIKNDN